MSRAIAALRLRFERLDQTPPVTAAGTAAVVSRALQRTILTDELRSRSTQPRPRVIRCHSDGIGPARTCVLIVAFAGNRLACRQPEHVWVARSRACCGATSSRICDGGLVVSDWSNRLAACVTSST